MPSIFNPIRQGSQRPMPQPSPWGPRGDVGASGRPFTGAPIPYAGQIAQQNQQAANLLWSPTMLQSGTGRLQATPNFQGQAAQNPALQGLVAQTQGMSADQRNAYFNELSGQIGGRLARFERRIASGSALDPAQTARYNSLRQSMNSLSNMQNNPMFAAQQGVGGAAGAGGAGTASGGLTSGFLTQSNFAIQQAEQMNRPDLAANYADVVRQRIQQEIDVFNQQQSQGLPLNDAAQSRLQQLQQMLSGVTQYIDRMRMNPALQNVPQNRPNPDVPRSPYSPVPPGGQSMDSLGRIRKGGYNG